MANGRYKVQGNWTVTESTEIDAPWLTKPAGVVLTEQADALDTKTGTVYSGGAFRVRTDKCTLAGRPRGKTFIGETAWSLAENLHRDTVSTLHQLASDAADAE